MRFVWLFLLFAISLSAGDIKPISQIKTDAPILDMSAVGGKLFACSAKGDVYELDKKLKKLYSLPIIETPYGDKRAQKAFSVDVSPSFQTIAVAAEDGSLYVAKNGKLAKTSFFTYSVIKKVLLINDNLALISMVSSEVVLFDIGKNRVLYSAQVSTSPLSDVALSKDKKTAAIVGEAGVVYIFDIMSGKTKVAYKNVNLDNIYKLDYQNSLILTAGQDRKATLVTDKGVIKARFAAKFLIYAVALSPSGSKAAVAVDEQNNISIFDTLIKKEISVAKGHTATLNKIIFKSENEMVSSADENKILVWRIK